MKIYDTVQTEKVAKEIIQDYITNNNLKDGKYGSTTLRCECGETTAITLRNDDNLLTVAVCDGCGDDDAFYDEVLEIL